MAALFFLIYGCFWLVGLVLVGIVVRWAFDCVIKGLE